MNQSTVATIVTIIAGVFAYFGVPGITSSDIEGFVHVTFAIVTLASFGWAHIEHKKELGRALTGKYYADN